MSRGPQTKGVKREKGKRPVKKAKSKSVKRDGLAKEVKPISVDLQRSEVSPFRITFNLHGSHKLTELSRDQVTLLIEELETADSNYEDAMGMQKAIVLAEEKVKEMVAICEDYNSFGDEEEVLDALDRTADDMRQLIQKTF